MFSSIKSFVVCSVQSVVSSVKFIKKVNKEIKECQAIVKYMSEHDCEFFLSESFNKENFKEFKESQRLN